MLSAIVNACKTFFHQIKTAIKQSTKPETAVLATGVASDITRSRKDLIAENAILRQQLIVLKRQVKRPKFTLPLFESGQLCAGNDNPQQVQRQLTDWTNSGKVIQLRRGLYTLGPPYQSEQQHSYLIANRMVHASYVSLHTALSHYDLIPEHVAVVTSVTTGRPGKRQNPYGHFSYQHIQPALFFGFQYRQVTIRLVTGPLFAFVACIINSVYPLMNQRFLITQEELAEFKKEKIENLLV
ncbi:MAG: hypothetical protein WAM60_26145 [Candidatus Promineifilaceae bacterium]